MDIKLDAEKIFASKPPVYEPNVGTFLLASLDLTNSTEFKNTHPDIWPNVFLSFYTEMSFRINFIKELFAYNQAPIDVGLWKYNGDECLIYVKVESASQLLPLVKMLNVSIETLVSRMANLVCDRYEHQGTALDRCNAIRREINQTIGVKGTAWIADCKSPELSDAQNISFSMNVTDFIGMDIDEGFRLAKYACKNRFIVSPLLAWMILKEAKRNGNLEEVHDQFRITGYSELKGVWNGRKVPLIVYLDSYQNLAEDLGYDEDELPAFNNLKDKQPSDFISDSRFYLERMNHILRDVGKRNYAENLYKALSDSEEKLEPQVFEKQKELARMITDEMNTFLNFMYASF